MLPPNKVWLCRSTCLPALSSGGAGETQLLSPLPSAQERQSRGRARLMGALCRAVLRCAQLAGPIRAVVGGEGWRNQAHAKFGGGSGTPSTPKAGLQDAPSPTNIARLHRQGHCPRTPLPNTRTHTHTYKHLYLYTQTYTQTHNCTYILYTHLDACIDLDTHIGHCTHILQFYVYFYIHTHTQIDVCIAPSTHTFYTKR